MLAQAERQSQLRKIKSHESCNCTAEKILSSVESVLMCIDRLAFLRVSPLLVRADNFSSTK